MSTAVSVNQNEHIWGIEAEVDLNSSAAVTAVRGTGAACTKTGTGTYNINITARGGLKMYEVLQRFADLGGAPTGAFWAKITSITQTAASGDTAPDAAQDIVISVTTLNNAATPAATDVTGACTLTVGVILRTNRMTNPFS